MPYIIVNEAEPLELPILSPVIGGGVRRGVFELPAGESRHEAIPSDVLAQLKDIYAPLVCVTEVR